MILQTRNSFKPRSFRFSYIIGFLIIISNSILPSNTGKLAGVILDSETDGGILAVNVIVKETLLGTITDEDGHYFVLNIPPGNYEVVFSHIGYQEIQLKGTDVLDTIIMKKMNRKFLKCILILDQMKMNIM